MNSRSVPVLMYHSIYSVKDNTNIIKNRYNISYSNIKSHIEYLRSINYQSIEIDDTMLQRELDNKLLITFDDGYVSNYHYAFPLLIENGYRGIFFVSTNLIGKNGLIDKWMIQDMNKNGMTFGSHGKSHIAFTQLDDKKLYSELSDSKKILEDIVGKRIKYISFPGGWFNNKIIDISNSIGYTAFFTSKYEYWQYPNRIIPRITISSIYNKKLFKILLLNNVGYNIAKCYWRSKEIIRNTIKYDLLLYKIIKI